MSITPLTTGSIQRLLTGKEDGTPVLQIIKLREITTAHGQSRHLVTFSDGVHSSRKTMLGTHLTPSVADGTFTELCIIKLIGYNCAKIGTDKQTIVLCNKLEVLHSSKEVKSVIGDPIPFQANTAGSESNNSVKPKPVVDSKKKPSSVRQQPDVMNSPIPSKKLPFSSSSGPSTPGGTPTSIIPIMGLTPYQNRWTIKARVTHKGNMREWKNARGEGKLFSFTVCDQSGSIRITCFKDEADKFFDLIEVNKVYTISSAMLKPANQQYNNTEHDYEMTFRRDSIVTLCEESESNLIPQVNYNFVPIKQLPQNVGKMADVIGVVKDCDPISTVMIKSQNREASIRKFTLVDQSNAQIRVTLWGSEAEQFNPDNNPVVAFKSAKISDYGGCTMSTTSMSTIMMNPEISESYQLKQWFASGGGQNVESISSDATKGAGSANWKTLLQIKDENLGFGEKPDYVTSKVTILYCKKDNSLYQACASEQCNKKVVSLGNGEYRCEKCNTNSPDFKYRMILNLHVADEFESQWVTCFQEQGELLLGVSSKELGEMKEDDENAYEAVLRKMYFTNYFMKFRVKAERFNDEQRIRVSAVNVSPVSFTDYNKKLLSDLRQSLTQ